MLIKTLLNNIYRMKSFVYGKIEIIGNDNDTKQLEVTIIPRKNSKALCSKCKSQAPTYDTLKERRYEHVPLWGMVVYFLYSPRRVSCKYCNKIIVEHLPWSQGKCKQTNIMKQYLAFWAKKLSWNEVATIFNTSWNRVYDAVRWVVSYGLEKRSLENISAIGIDEIMSWKGHRCFEYITFLHQ